MKPRIKAPREDAAAVAQGDAQVEDITLSEQIYRLLRRDIMRGAFAPGCFVRRYETLPFSAAGLA